MVRPIYYVVAIHICLINNGLSYDLCEKASLKVNFNCGNIYIWKSDHENFVSLLNVTFGKPRESDLRGLEGKTVKVIADNMKPYIMSNNQSNELSGYLGDIWNIVEEALKFKSNVRSVNYDNGLIIMSEGKADVMLAAGVVKRGLIGVKYSQPYLYNWYHLYIKTPELRASSTSYLKTLHQDLWLVSFLVFSILTVSLWLTIKFLNSTCQLEQPISLPSCLLSVSSGFLNQGFDLGLETYSARIIIIFAFIPGYVLYCAMNAVLVAQQAIFTVDLPFDSIEDVRKIGGFSLCLRTNSFVYNNFTYRNEVNSHRAPLPRWENTLNGPGCKDINIQANLAEILCDDGIVILENRVVMATVTRNFWTNCDLSFLTDRYFVTGNSYLVRKSFHGSKEIETVIFHMKSVGVLQRLEEKWIRRKIIDSRSNTINHVLTPQVTFQHIRGVLFFYIMMILISLILLRIEIIISKHFSPRIGKTDVYPFVK